MTGYRINPDEILKMLNASDSDLDDSDADPDSLTLKKIKTNTASSKDDISDLVFNSELREDMPGGSMNSRLALLLSS